MRTNNRRPICIYCGERGGTTRDHVPPKGLFAKPRPDLITVPCCEQCRKGQSLDDEYFVLMIGMKSGTHDNPSVIRARSSAVRSLMKPAKRRFTQSFLRSTKKRSVYTATGIYLGQTLSYDVDLERLCRVIERTVCGLYFHKFGERLPDGHECKTYAVDGFNASSHEAIVQLQELWRHALSGEKQNFGENVFTYWVRKVDGPEGATLWSFLVYGSVPFLALTGPKLIPLPSQYDPG